MSRKFNLEDNAGYYVMHCKTKEEAEDFCRFLHEAGRKWSDGKSYLSTTHWEEYGDVTCYNFNTGRVGRAGFFLAHGYTVLEWDFFREYEEFTKDDLRNGDVVLRRNGDVEILMSEVLDGIFIDKNNGHGEMMFLSDDLTFEDFSDRDIIAVRRPNDISDISFDAFEKKLGRLVYERDETVEMTLEEVCKALGKNVKIVKEVK